MSGQLKKVLKQADDPLLYTYVFTNLGKGVPETSVYQTTLNNTKQQILLDLFKVPEPIAVRETPAQRLVRQALTKQREALRRQALKQHKEKLEQMVRDREHRQQVLEQLVRGLLQEKPEELLEWLTADDVTSRWLAVQVVATRRLHLEKELIDRLDDPVIEVREAARQALVRLGRGTDFGPAPNAAATQRAQAVEKWRTWLALQDAPAQGASLKAGTVSDAKVTDPLPLQAVDAEATRLSKKLLQASPGEQEDVLRELQAGKGAVYTQALATVIPQLNGDLRAKARDALAERLTRMTADTLRDKLKDDNGEVRRAAALACAMKEDKNHIPDLITLLSDAEPPVSRAARAALRELSGQDFGPESNASKTERAQAIAAWKAWWAKQEKK